MNFNSLVPELYVADFQKSLDFYTKILGFTLEYQRSDPLFAFLSYLESQIMIQEIDPNEDKAFMTGQFDYPFGRGINFQIKTTDAEQLIEKIRSHNYPLQRGLKESWYKVKNTSYGYKEFLLLDPDGYLLRFSQPI